MSEQRDLAAELAAANGIAEDALREVRMEQARKTVAAEKRKAARYRFVAMSAWTVTLIVVFASMWMAVVFLFGIDALAAPPRANLLLLTMMGTFAMMSFVVAIIASVAWYFSARSASLKGIDTRLGQLEAILKAEIAKERGTPPST